MATSRLTQSRGDDFSASVFSYVSMVHSVRITRLRPMTTLYQVLTALYYNIVGPMAYN